MALITPANAANRPAFVTAAAVALALNAIANLANVGGSLSGAPIPPAILAVEVALGIGALIAAVSLWGRRRWAVPAALVLAVLNIALGVVGIATAGSTAGKAVAATGALLGIVVLALAASLAARRVAD